MIIRYSISGLCASARRRHWLFIAICAMFLLLVLTALLVTAKDPKRIATFMFAFVWLLRLALGAGAGYAALRLWDYRSHPLIGRLGLYINAFVLEALTAIVLLFVARGVKFTWTFTIVMFVGALLGDMVRAPLIMYLIRGPEEEVLPASTPASGAMPPDFWRKEFREAVREELEPIKAKLAEVEQKLVRREG